MVPGRDECVERRTPGTGIDGKETTLENVCARGRFFSPPVLRGGGAVRDTGNLVLGDEPCRGIKRQERVNLVSGRIANVNRAGTCLAAAG